VETAPFPAPPRKTEGAGAKSVVQLNAHIFYTLRKSERLIFQTENAFFVEKMHSTFENNACERERAAAIACGILRNNGEAGFFSRAGHRCAAPAEP
jgi:hypothetical protein